jgi:1,2-diacylglycerol 3-alpha-glucosyltransferase
MSSVSLAITFTNFGPYHLARLRALAGALQGQGGRLIAYEVAGNQQLYPWARNRSEEPFERITLFPGKSMETVSAASCRSAQRQALDRDQPDAVAIVGYSRPESLAALRWSRARGRPTVLMSETGWLDHRRLWWKEAIKRRRVQRFSAALVGGPRHRDYLEQLGMPKDRIAFGYNAVDNDFFAERAKQARNSEPYPTGPAKVPYFLSVSRFAPEKNLPNLIGAFAVYRRASTRGVGWDLVLCGDGPAREEIEHAIRASGLEHAVHRPGFLQAEGLARWYAHTSAFVLASRSEPWGLVANEAAASGLPLLVSDVAGCAETLVPDPAGTSGRRFDPFDEDSIAGALSWMADCDEAERRRMGERAAEIVANWGPERFAGGTLQALELAIEAERFRRWGKRHMPMRRTSFVGKEHP